MDSWPIPKMPDDEERYVRFKPAYHKCHPDPRQNYGIGSVKMLWILRVGDWAMTWDISTDWGLPDEAFKAANPDCTHHMHQHGYPSHKATGGAVDWHSPVPSYEDQPMSQEICSITGTACYLDSGFLVAEELFKVLRTEGDEAVWQRLRSLLEEARLEVAEVAPSSGE